MSFAKNHLTTHNVNKKTLAQVLLSIALLCLALIAVNSALSQTMQLDFNKPRFKTEVTDAEAMRAISAQDARADGLFIADLSPHESSRRRLENRNVGYVVILCVGSLRSDTPAVLVASLAGVAALVDNIITNKKNNE